MSLTLIFSGLKGDTPSNSNQRQKKSPKMPPDKRILNAMKRSEVHRKEKRAKAQAKLKRRMETRKTEREDPEGDKAREARLAKNVPRTLDNARQFDAGSYLTADPTSAASLAARSRLMGKKKKVEVPVKSEGSGSEEDDDENRAGPGPSSAAKMKKRQTDEDEDMEDNEGEDDAEEGEQDGEDETSTKPSPFPTGPFSDEPPRILLTTSPHATQATHAFMGELRSVLPGGEVYKRLKGRGFEVGRIARWAAKREFKAMVIVNEDHKTPNAITVINLPAGPTAYFKLTSVVLGQQISGHARPSPHSPELILNNFSTLLGMNVGRLFGSLFPPMPQFRGRQVVTLHNQRDFLFFRRHRYMFASTEKARLQEIGPRFTLKLRWLRKGLPSVLAADGVAPRSGDKAESEDEEDADEDVEDADVDMERTDKPTVAGENEDDDDDEANANEEEIKGKKRKDMVNGVKIPALDEEQEYEWKWKPKMEVSRTTFFM